MRNVTVKTFKHCRGSYKDLIWQDQFEFQNLEDFKDSIGVTISFLQTQTSQK
jgi:hypothetical protein